MGIRLQSLNKRRAGTTRGAMFAEASRVKMIREAVRLAVVAALNDDMKASRLTAVHVTRVGARLDEDNLVGACKPVADGIAKALGVNDREFSLYGRDPARIAYHPEQEFQGRGVYSIEIALHFE